MPYLPDRLWQSFANHQRWLFNWQTRESLPFSDNTGDRTAKHINDSPCHYTYM